MRLLNESRLKGRLSLSTTMKVSRAQSLWLIRITQQGGTAMVVGADVRSVEACREMLAAVQAELGLIDSLVLNAGKAKGGPLIAADLDAIRDTIDTNLTAAIQLTALTLPIMMRKRFGRVIAISSAVAEQGGMNGQCAYAASKAGLIGFIKTLATEMSPRANFTANLVSPGIVPTDMSAFGIQTIGDALKNKNPRQALWQTR